MCVYSCAHISNNENADNDLESPIDNIFVWEDYDHKEYYERQS